MIEFSPRSQSQIGNANICESPIRYAGHRFTPFGPEA